MVLKRQLGAGGEEASDLPNKRRQLLSTLFRGATNARTLEATVSILEPLIRKWVQESVEETVSRLQRSSNNQIECSGSRSLQLQLHGNLPATLFTGSRILSEGRCPIRIALYDSSTNQIVTSGPLSSIKVNIVVLDGDFRPDDEEDWTKKEFDRKIVHNREGKRPLVTGELTVQLQGGVGCIGEVSFTDNSSWIRSGKFRLGAKVHTSSNEVNIREGMSNAFKVKDHRGESYQKHYPPSLLDEVWRLEKIAKDGTSHKRLTDAGICCVRDFMRLYFRDQFSLRNIFGSISNRIWDKIIEHALTCTLDDEKYLYRSAHGMGLLFNSIHKLVGVTFDGQSYHSVDSLDLFQMRMVESMKQHAYRKSAEWVPFVDPPIIGYPLLLPSPAAIDFNSSPNLVLPDADFPLEQDVGTQLNTHQATISPSYNCDVEQDSSSYEVGESSHQGFDPAFSNSYGMSNSPGSFCIGDQTWHNGNNFIGSNLSIDKNFQAWQGNGLFLGPTNHPIGIISSNSGILIPRNGSPKTRWYKVLAVVKWRILRRNVAAKKWKQFNNYV